MEQPYTFTCPVLLLHNFNFVHVIEQDFLEKTDAPVGIIVKIWLNLFKSPKF